MFSSRLPRSLTPNPLTSALAARRAAGLPVLDLTLSNPTRAGLDYPADLLTCLSDVRALTYNPSPLGLLDARGAVSADYARRGVMLDPSHVAITASTSEAYSVLFKVLCEPGDAILVPRPSYPLFDHLAALDGVLPVPYDLEYHGRWAIDFDSIARGWTARTRGLVAVHPNNPTGSLVTADEFDRLARWCRDRDAPLIVDEVFADYAFDNEARSRPARVLERDDVVVFSLGGLSKTVGLPQAKLAWIGVGGPRAGVDEALSRLEFVGDTYLSTSTPVQLAASELLSRGERVRAAIQARIGRNRRQLAAADLAAHGCTLLEADGGWSAVLQVPSFEPEESLVLRLLRERGLLVHPGYFFDFPRESYVVLSLLVPERDVSDGLSRLIDHLVETLETGRRP